MITLALPRVPAPGVMTAAKEGHVNVLELLLQCGADVDAVNKQGDSALVFAATEGHEVRLADLGWDCVPASLPSPITDEVPSDVASLLMFVPRVRVCNRRWCVRCSSTGHAWMGRGRATVRCTGPSVGGTWGSPACSLPRRHTVVSRPS